MNDSQPILATDIDIEIIHHGSAFYLYRVQLLFYAIQYLTYQAYNTVIYTHATTTDCVGGISYIGVDINREDNHTNTDSHDNDFIVILLILDNNYINNILAYSSILFTIQNNVGVSVVNRTCYGDNSSKKKNDLFCLTKQKDPFYEFPKKKDNLLF